MQHNTNINASGSAEASTSQQQQNMIQQNFEQQPVTKPRRGRGRPKKTAQTTIFQAPLASSSTTAAQSSKSQAQVASSPTTAAEANNSQAPVASSSTTAGTNTDETEKMDEVDKAIAASTLRKSTKRAYNLPLLHWREFCEENRYRFPISSDYTYTVGPTEFVVEFFEEFVFKRTCNKNIPINFKFRTQFGLRSEEDEEIDRNAASLDQALENAPISKDGKYKLLTAPIGIENVKQYKKALAFLFEFQSAYRPESMQQWVAPLNDQKVNGIISQ